MATTKIQESILNEVKEKRKELKKATSLIRDDKFRKIERDLDVLLHQLKAERLRKVKEEKYLMKDLKVNIPKKN